jgi:hypothetical protein
MDMTPPKSEQELERLAEEYAEANEGDNHYSGFKAGYRAAEANALERISELEAEVRSLYEDLAGASL